MILASWNFVVVVWRHLVAHKVCQVDMAIGVQQDIIRFYVSVYNALAVYIS